ncbi:MAG: ribonucleotide-diphosphate reductase subunit beta [Ktedonobacteraceae bacterium]|jgi:ribonucleoside-diphosphate reductase beta chain
MSIEMPLESASLAQLQQTPIENVINIIDEGLVHLPSYRELYYRWERQQWRAQEIDFTPDRLQWEKMSEEEHQDRINGLSAFFKGEACVTDTLAPYVTAMPDEEMRIFVTTQLVDEARHTVFFARFFKEVIGIDKGLLEHTLDEVQQYMNADLKYILIDSLTEVAERIRQEPQNIAHLVEGITLYHVVVEGTLALAGQRSILDFYRQNNLFPAFRGGFTAVARDESRHVVFGVKFLRDMIQHNPQNARIVQAAIDKYAPIALKSLTPADEFIPHMLSMQLDPWVTPRYAQDSLRKKIKVIGLSMELPAVPPPPVF